MRSALVLPAETAAASIPVRRSGSAGRLMSLDAFRGFILFWIVPGDLLTSALAKLHGGGPFFTALSAQFYHAKWVGFRFYDLIFPAFVFMVGASIPFSLGKIIEQEGRSGAARRIFRRTLLLFLLGVFYNGGLTDGLDAIRWMGVLQRLALCYGAAALCWMWVGRKGLFAIWLGILLGYWGLLMWFPVPGIGAGSLEPDRNLVHWIDQLILPGRMHCDSWDPEGILSTLPAVASCLIGVFAGGLLRDPARSNLHKLTLLSGSGLAMLVAGYAWSLQFPIIKALWTSSFVLVAGGWSLLLLAGFYLIIDHWKLRTWAMPLVWMGMNVITLYLLGNLVDLESIARRFIGGDAADWLNALRPNLEEMVAALVSAALCFALARFLYKRQIFLRI